MCKCWECLKETNENDAAYHVIETEENDRIRSMQIMR